MHFAFACVDMMGHLMPLVPFMKELHQRGHRVTVFMSDNPKHQAKLVEFELGDAESITVPLPDDQKVFSLSLREVIAAGGPLAILSAPLFDAITGHYHGKAALPAVIVADFFTTAAMDAGDALGVPVIVVFPNPLGVVKLLSPSQRGLSQKILGMLSAFGEGLLARLFLLLRNRQRRLRGLPRMIEQDIWPCDTMRRPFISTWGLGYEYASLQSPLLTFVGPSDPASFQALSGDLAAWFERQTLPIVYVAFGTMHEFTRATCSRLLRELEGLSDVAVLWSLPASQQALISSQHSTVSAAGLPVRLESFVPQYAVLKHPKVAVFVTHCGSNSVSEAILAEKPLVCCPGSKDQPANAGRVCSARIGVIAKGGVAGVGAAAREVLHDLSGYRERVIRVKRVQLSHGGAKRGADVMEAVAAVGYDHLMPVAQRASLLRIGIGLFGIAYVFCVTARGRAIAHGLPLRIGLNKP